MMLSSFLKFISRDRRDKEGKGDLLANAVISSAVLSQAKVKLLKSWLVSDDKLDIIRTGYPVAKARISDEGLLAADIAGRVIFKHNTPILSMCEAAFGDCYRLILGNKSPKVRVVYDDIGKEILGICVEEVVGFVDIYMLQQTAKWMKQVAWSQLSLDAKEAFAMLSEEFNGVEIKKLHEIAKRYGDFLDPVVANISLGQPSFMRQLAEIFVVSYVFEEEDLHKRNFGIDVTGMACRIDFDMNFFGNVYAQTRGVPLVAAWSASNVSWQVSAEDIVNFPVLTTAKPWYWPTIDTATNLGDLAAVFGEDRIFTAEDVALFSRMAQNTEFIAAKYRCFLKLLLIPERCFQEIFKFHFLPATNVEVDSLRSSLVAHLEDRLTLLRKTLCQIPEFCEFLSEKELVAVVIQELVGELPVEKGKDVPDLEQEISGRHSAMLEAIAISRDITLRPSN